MEKMQRAGLYGCGGCDCGRPLADEGRRRLHRRISLFALNARGWRYASQSAVRGVDTCSSATKSTCVRGFLCCLLSLSRGESQDLLHDDAEELV